MEVGELEKIEDQLTDLGEQMKYNERNEGTQKRKEKKIRNKSTMEKRPTPVKNTKKKNNKEEKTRKKKKRKEVDGSEGWPDSGEGVGEKVRKGSKIDSQRKWENVDRVYCGSSGPRKR